MLTVRTSMTKTSWTWQTVSSQIAMPAALHTAEMLVLPEPTIRFGHSQAVEDPRDGLTLFGPLETGQPHGIRVGVIGTPRGLECYRSWVARIQGPLFDRGSVVAHPPYPGFEAAFRVPWPVEPALTLTISEAELRRTVHLKDRHQRVFQTVGLYVDRILASRSAEDRPVD